MGCLIPTWCETVGDCLEHSVIVRRYCERCQRPNPVDLIEMAVELGPDYWMWDRRTPCPGCGAMLIYGFSPAEGTPLVPMISTNRHDVARSERMRA